MAGECLCVHAIRRDVTNRVRVRASASVSGEIALAGNSSVLIDSTANKHAFALAQLGGACALTTELDLLRPMNAALNAHVTVNPLPDRIRGLDLMLTATTAVAPKASKTNAVQFTFLTQLLDRPQKSVAHHTCRLPKKTCYREFERLEDAENSGITFNDGDVIRTLIFPDNQTQTITHIGKKYKHFYWRAKPKNDVDYSFGGVSWDRGFRDDPLIKNALDACPEPLVITPGGNILPAFQYQAKIKENPKPPPRKQNMDVLRAAKSAIEAVSGIAPKLTYFLDAEAELKAQTTIDARADVGNMSVLIKFAPLLGKAPTLPLRSNRLVLSQREGVARLFPVVRTSFTSWRPPIQRWRSPNELYMQQEHSPHNCYKENEKRPPCCDPRRFKFCCISTVMARPTSEAGELTRINKKKDKLRLVQVLHPDSKKQNEDGSFPPKKYVWRLTVHPENDPPCACEFVHIGLYIFRDSVWKFNQLKPVLLLVNSADFQTTTFNSCFFMELPYARFYPQFNEHGEYRVVMVKNLMYDIYPPSTFVRTEYEGVPPSPVDREVILNELAHLVFVYEGCGNNFFLINAECD